MIEALKASHAHEHTHSRLNRTLTRVLFSKPEAGPCLLVFLHQSQLVSHRRLSPPTPRLSNHSSPITRASTSVTTPTDHKGVNKACAVQWPSLRSFRTCKWDHGHTPEAAGPSEGLTETLVGCLVSSHCYHGDGCCAKASQRVPCSSRSLCGRMLRTICGGIT